MARIGMRNISRLIDRAKDELPIEEAFLGDLKRSIEKEDQQERRKPSQFYKPSSMNCLRNMYYQRTGKEPDESAASYIGIGICNAGTDIHVRVQRAVHHMKRMGFDCVYLDVGKYIQKHAIPDVQVVQQSGFETKLRHEKLALSFMCDGIIKYLGKYYILELKSESSYKWSQRGGVDPSHYHQATAYSISLGLDKVIFVYINRDTLDMKAYMFEPTPDMKQDLIGMIENCEGYVKRMIAPPRPVDVDRKTCEYCNYKSSCRKEV